MWIQNLKVNNFRNYFYENIDFNEDINIFLGDNAQGKTNLLEAVYYLSNARSFKTVRDRDIIMFKENSMKLEGKIRKKNSFKNVSIKVNDKDKDIYVNDIKYSKNKDLKALFKLVLFTPEDLSIIKEGPNFRRELFDDIIVSVDYSYSIIKKNFEKILFQRNKLLKNQKSKYFKEQLAAFDRQIIKLAYTIYQRREKFVKLINGFAKSYHQSLSNNKEDLEITYKPDIFAQSFDQYEEEFKKNIANDLKLMTTTSGVNRDDIDIKINGKAVKKFASQGQQRSVILNIKLAQVKLIKESSSDKAIILFDDVFSELDENRSQFLLNNLGAYQTIITATNIKSLENVDKSKVRKISDGHILS
ncbi:MAG: DNA replication/repair protein RecF [Peptoniphilaceae bacterium]|nr:DNA replication/repair protein RecF [Peptoniphilaceae bacterium]MDY6018913.1 DNA replication/repair protein RecF [Anaerococcus sp.]